MVGRGGFMSQVVSARPAATGGVGRLDGTVVMWQPHRASHLVWTAVSYPPVLPTAGLAGLLVLAG